MRRAASQRKFTAYQLSFNPADSKWTGKQKKDWWPCYTTKVQQGDEVFLIRLGEIPEPMKGIVGWGIATRETYPRESRWGHTAIDFHLSVVVRRDEPPLVPLSILKELPGSQDWSNRRCGIGIKSEAFNALHQLLGSAVPPPGTDPARRIRALVNVRLRQAAFSAAVRGRFDGRCVLSGLGERFATAAHIVGYTECKTAQEQDDPDNGLFLAGHLHLAFDGHLFGIRPDGIVVWSKRIYPDELKRLGPLKRRIPVSAHSRPYLERRWKRFQECEGESDRIATTVTTPQWSERRSHRLARGSGHLHPKPCARPSSARLFDAIHRRAGPAIVVSIGFEPFPAMARLLRSPASSRPFAPFQPPERFAGTMSIPKSPVRRFDARLIKPAS